MMRLLTSCLCACLLLTTFACDDDDTNPTPAPSEKRTINIGAMLALTGSLSDLGTSGQAALNLAIEDVNNRTDLDVEIAPVTIEDSETNAATALTLLQQMQSQGLNVVVGPQSSAEVAAVKDFADANDMVIISPSSVARTLSIAGDNIYRFAPDDTYQALAMTQMLVEDDLDALIIVARDDVWGNDLSTLVDEDYTTEGGDIPAQYDYDPSLTDFGQLMTFLASDVTEEIQSHGADKVGVLLLSFSEGESILTAAAAEEVLGTVKWYGASAVAQSFSLINNPTAAEFAERTGFPCPVYGLDEDARARWEPLKAKINAEIGRDPDIYALTAYDIVQVIAETYDAIGNNDIADFKAEFVNTAANHAGVSGNIVLNAAGDREAKSLDFWSIKTENGEKAWVRTAVYDAENETLTRQ